MVRVLWLADVYVEIIALVGDENPLAPDPGVSSLLGSLPTFEDIAPTRTEPVAIAESAASTVVADVDRSEVAGSEGAGLIVDPARCRIWEGNSRLYDRLSEASCADLLDSIRSHGGNFVPAIVRPVKGDAEVDYEVVAGVRRLWCVRWLRERGFEDVLYRVTCVEDGSSLALFRYCEGENSVRGDLSPYERGRSLAYALKHVFADDVKALAVEVRLRDRLVYRLIALHQLPRSVVDAFGDVRVLSVTYGDRLAKALASARKAVEREAQSLAREQRARAQRDEPFLSAREVVTRLLRAADLADSAKIVIGPVLSARGNTLVSGHFVASTGWKLVVPAPRPGDSVDEYLAALREVLSAGFS